MKTLLEGVVTVGEQEEATRFALAKASRRYWEVAGLPSDEFTHEAARRGFEDGMLIGISVAMAMIKSAPEEFVHIINSDSPVENFIQSLEFPVGAFEKLCVQ